jgi:tRNA dimethylallyltransferase
MSADPHAPPVPMLLGPTASGKTAIALRLAEHLPIEIVSVDSALVYRGMDIGTAKPDAAERAAVPHHLLDLIEPTEAYSAARFVRDARAAIAAIRSRGRLPLLVGGTMLYAKALAEGLDDLPAADPAVRARLEDEARSLGWPALHARLAEVDPATAARLAPHDAQRIQRALEVWLLTGEPMSARLRTPEPTAGEAPRTGLRVVRIALEPSVRATLHARIAERFEHMLRRGLLDEVRALRARGDLDAAMPSMRCVGYRQAWEHLDGRYDAASLRERGIAATRQLAKRQLTWLRAMPERAVVDCLDAQAFERVAALVAQAVGA